MNNNRKPFVNNKNIEWSNSKEKERYVELKQIKEKSYTPPKKKVLIKQKENGFANIMSLKYLTYLSITILIMIFIIMMKR